VVVETIFVALNVALDGGSSRRASVVASIEGAILIIVAGALFASAASRSDYLVGCGDVVDQARHAEGCLDFALSADLLDERRINVYERWATEADMYRFRGSGPSDEQNNEIQDADVQEFRIDLD
jgi:quinol monooxygenase YgiN